MNATCLLLALVVAAPAPKDKPKPGPDVVGDWIVESITTNGRLLPQGAGNELCYSFTKEGQWKIRRGDSEVASTLNRRFELNTKVSPATFDLVILRDMTESSRMNGIVKIEGDTMTIVVCRTKGERPKSFDANDPNAQSTYLLKRKK